MVCGLPAPLRRCAEAVEPDDAGARCCCSCNSIIHTPITMDGTPEGVEAKQAEVAELVERGPYQDRRALAVGRRNRFDGAGWYLPSWPRWKSRRSRAVAEAVMAR